MPDSQRQCAFVRGSCRALGQNRRDMIHHIDFAVADLVRSREFYERALAPLGLGVSIVFTNYAGHRCIGFGRVGWREGCQSLLKTCVSAVRAEKHSRHRFSVGLYEPTRPLSRGVGS